MELQQLRYVVAIADTGGFTRAAEHCHVVQSALSHQVARLERELGAPLFLRNSRRVALTAAGEVFLPAARAALAAAERARSEVAATAGLLSGTLSLGTIPTFTALDAFDLLARFRARHPDVEVALHGGHTNALVTELHDGRLDVALIGVPESYTPPAGIVGETLATEGLVLLTRPDHPLASHGTARLADLAGEVFADNPLGSQARVQTDEAFTRAGVDRRVDFVVDHNMVTRCVRAGLGVALLPAGVVDPGSGLVEVPLVDPPTRKQVVAWLETPSPAARALLGLAGIL